MKVLEVENLTKNYGRSRGIKDVSFAIDKQDIFGFIGPNGAGKSTTIRTILGLIKPSQGKVLIFGKDTSIYQADVLNEIGYLPSEVAYYDKMSVRDFLNYSASFYKKDCQERILYLSDVLELDLNKRIDSLSYGNKKKVGIIQGLLHSPSLIILDEPTGGLDPLMQQRFFDLLLEENKRGATILFSSHILSEVQKLCNRVAIIKDGQIVSIEDMNALNEKNYQKVSFNCEIDLSEKLASVNDIKDLDINNTSYNFLFQGHTMELLEIFKNLKISNLYIKEPSLEEIFMHYYE